MKRKSLSKQLISGILSAIMVLGLMPMINASAASFNPRFSLNNIDCQSKYWAPGQYGVSNGFPRNWNKGGGNCTWYAFGRAWELIGSLPKLCTNNAGAWWNYNKNNNYYSYGTIPKLGAIAVWDKYDGNNGHVAVVEEIGDNYIICSESGWGYTSTYFRTVKRNLKSSTLDMGSNYRFLGYIYILNNATQNNSHTHNWIWYDCWEAHPHYNMYRCSTCGQLSTGSGDDRIIFDNCNECHPKPTPAPQPPSAPSIRVSAANFAVGKSVTVSWNSVDKATGYDVNIVNSSNSSYNQSASVGGTSTSFNINHSGTYTVTVKAKNQYGSSGNSNTVTIKAYNPSTVTFTDYDGTELSTQKVNYGESATEPDTPIREGYTFTGWDKGFSKITTDTIVKAQYKINTYTIRFINREGETIDTQRIDYSSSATPPTPPEAPVGYTFSGWDTEEYKCVKKDLSVHAVYVWENDDLPIKFTTSPIVRRNEIGSGYTADLQLYNYPDTTTDGKIVVVLKTSEGKMVASKTEAISLSAGASSTRSIFIPYDGVASTAEVTVVAIINNDKTGVPISEKAVIDVDLNLEWSNWSIVKPNQSNNLTVEERTEYRYRTKSTTTSSNSSMSGWTKYDTTSSWGDWSGWLNYNPGSSSTRQTSTRWIEPTYKTVYNYAGYRGWKGSNYYQHFCPTSLSNMGYSASWVESGWVDDDVWRTDWSQSQYCSCHGTFYGYYSYKGYKYYYKYSDRVQITPGYTQWKYRDLNYTYHFYKWNDWSDWSTNSITANDNREVETRSSYRYKSEFSSDMENNEGERRTLNGHIDNVKDGKQVTLYVFKGTNTDPTESQLEYVGQSVLSNGGEYSFEYITKEEPSEKTGDFIIMVGVEGAISPFYVDTIKAPVPSYTVNFAVDGKTIDTQIVSEGNSANIPEAPEKEGYTFVGWDTGVTNIHDDITINAVYAPNKYSVIFLDWDNKTIDTKTFNYGDVIETPDANEKEGSTFIGWDKIIDGTTTVTKNMIITAQYDLNEYEVVFYDSDGSVISKQTVKYGEAADVPGDPILEGYAFYKWNQTIELMSVTHNLSVYPEFKYEQTAEMPIFSVYDSETEDGQIVMIASDDTDAIIYYTTDGTEPCVESSELGIEHVNGNVYSEALELNIGTVVKAVSYVDGKNTSDTSVCYVEKLPEDKQPEETENPSATATPIIPTDKPAETDAPETPTPSVNPTETEKPSETDEPIAVPEAMPFEIKNAAINSGYVSANVMNISDTVQSGMVIFAAYSDTGSLLSVNIRQIENLDANASRPCEFELPSGAMKSKLFVWRSWKDMLPMANSVEVK